MYQFHPQAYADALLEFDRALEIDADYAAVHGWRAMAQFGLAFSSPDRHERESHASSALASAEQGLSLDPDLGIAFAARAWVAFAIDWDFDRALALYRQALSVDENSWWVRWGYGEVLSALGRHTEAIEQMEQAYELDPVNPMVAVERASIHAHAGQADEAAKIIERALKVLPNHQELYDRLPTHLAAAGQFRRAIEANARFAALTGREYDADAHRMALEENGERGFWQWLLDAPEWQAGLVDRARLHARLGNEEKSIDLLSEAVEQRVPAAVFLRAYRELRPLHDHPLFDAVLRQAGFGIRDSHVL
jgi:tetratricopeptide (TPR) repeat protein